MDYEQIKLAEKKYIASVIKDKCLEKFDPPVLGKLPGSRYKGQYYLGNAMFSDIIFMYHALGTLIDYCVEKYPAGNTIPFQLAGTDWNSVPIMTTYKMAVFEATGRTVDINTFMVRKSRKTYGKHNYVEGIPNDLPVIIVGDVCNSTNGFKHCHDVVVNELGLKVEPFIFAILNKKSPTLNPEDYMYDKYLKTHQCVTACDVDDVHAA